MTPAWDTVATLPAARRGRRLPPGAARPARPPRHGPGDRVRAGRRRGTVRAAGHAPTARPAGGLRDDSTELHLSRNHTVSPGGCLIRVRDAAALWQRLQDQDLLGPLEQDNPGLTSFLLLDPDNNHLRFVSGP